jgi:hypothetical protein
MIRPGDRGRVLAYLGDRASRGFGITSAMAREQAGLRHLRSAEAREILDGLVDAGVATVGWERVYRVSDDGRSYGFHDMRVYRAVAARGEGLRTQDSGFEARLRTESSVLSPLPMSRVLFRCPESFPEGAMIRPGDREKYLRVYGNARANRERAERAERYRLEAIEQERIDRERRDEIARRAAQIKARVAAGREARAAGNVPSREQA